MKKIFLFIVLGLLFLNLVFAYTPRAKNEMKITYDSPIEKHYEISLDVMKGWNLLTGFIPEAINIKGGDISLNNIKAVWAYIPPAGKYAQVYPNIDTKTLNIMDDDQVLSIAFWVYSDKSGILTYETQDVVTLDRRNIYGGWNFIPVLVDMFSGTYDPLMGHEGEYFSWDSIKGTCNYEKIYFFNPLEQKWVIMNPTLKLKGYDFDDFMGYGFVVKVSNSCKLSKEVASGPPSLPA